MSVFKILPKKASERRFDTNAKTLLRHRTVLAKLVQFAVPEFRDCDIYEIIDAIPRESIKMGKVPVESDYAKLSSNELIRLNEKPITFDVFFRDDKFELMIDVEPQGKYNPGYSLIKRGIYYLARMLSSQLVPKRNTNYDSLKKCYSIWLCFDTLYKFNSRAAGEYHYGFRKISGGKTSEESDRKSDLMELIILRAGGSDKMEECLLDFVNSLFRDVDKVDKYLPETEDKPEINEEVHGMCDMVEVAVKSTKESTYKKCRAESAREKAELTLKHIFSVIKRFEELGYSESDIIDEISGIFGLSKEKSKSAYTKYVSQKH